MPARNRIKKQPVVRVTAPISPEGAQELVRRAQANNSSAGAELAAIAQPVLNKAIQKSKPGTQLRKGGKV